ncbi:DUF6893 family small protein [Streptosporangium sp. NPDC000396]
MIRRLLIGAIVIGIAIVIVQSLPDIVRYKRIRDM